MSHRTLIGGTAYEISGGKTLIDGTAYSIKNGKTLAGGTAYDVGFVGYKIIYDFGTINATSYYGKGVCIVNNFDVTFDLNECNAIMADGVLYEAFSEEINSNNFKLYPLGCDTSEVTADYPVSISFTKNSTSGLYMVWINLYTTGTHNISIGKIE